MAISAYDILLAQQAPEKLAKKLGKGITPSEAFFLKQDPYSVATKLGADVSTVFMSEGGSYELAKAVNALANSEEEGEEKSE